MAVKHAWTEPEKAIVADFQRWIRRKDLSLRGVARLLGSSHATASQLLSCTYSGKVPLYLDKIDRIIERWKRRAGMPDRPAFVPTATAERVHEVLRIAHTERCLALVLGPSGIGKTMAVRAYCQQEPDAAYVEAGPGCTPWVILRLLSGMLDVDFFPSTRVMRDRVIEALRGTDRLLVIDEADYMGEPPLQCLRIIAENANVGLVLVGTYAYLKKLRERKHATIGQIIKRIAYVEHLTASSREDIERIAGGFRLEPDAMNELVTGAKGEARRAVAALMAAHRLDGHAGSITAASVRAAFSQLMPLET